MARIELESYSVTSARRARVFSEPLASATGRSLTLAVRTFGLRAEPALRRAAEEKRSVGRPFLAVSVGLERPTYIAAAISFSAARLAAVVLQMAVLLAVARQARSQQAPASSGPDQKAAAPTDEQAQTERDRTKEREEILRQMRDRVRAMTVERIDDEAKGSEELMPDPLFRYSDERITVVGLVLRRL